MSEYTEINHRLIALNQRASSLMICNFDGPRARLGQYAHSQWMLMFKSVESSADQMRAQDVDAAFAWASVDFLCEFLDWYEDFLAWRGRTPLHKLLELLQEAISARHLYLHTLLKTLHYTSQILVLSVAICSQNISTVRARLADSLDQCAVISEDHDFEAVIHKYLCSEIITEYSKTPLRHPPRSPDMVIRPGHSSYCS